MAKALWKSYMESPQLPPSYPEFGQMVKCNFLPLFRQRWSLTTVTRKWLSGSAIVADNVIIAKRSIDVGRLGRGVAFRTIDIMAWLGLEFKALLRMIYAYF